MTEHTPLPWHAQAGMVIGPDGKIIAHTGGEGISAAESNEAYTAWRELARANALHIAKVVNAYDLMVVALRAWVAEHEEMGAPDSEPLIRAALAIIDK